VHQDYIAKIQNDGSWAFIKSLFSQEVEVEYYFEMQ